MLLTIHLVKIGEIMNLKKTIVLSAVVSAIALTGTGCASFSNGLEKNVTSWTGGEFRVILYSGGEAVREWQLNGIVREENGSDGWYFNCGGALVRISGDVVVEPLSQSKSAVQNPVICR